MDRFDEKTFRLAPMAGALRIFTWLLMPLPAAFVAFGVVAPPPAGPVLVGAGGFVVLIYASIWLYWRPSRFQIDRSLLRVRFPARAKAFPRAGIVGAARIDMPAFRERFGTAMRVGAGGLWGGFGWLWTSKDGWVEFYISRMTDLVLVERRDGRPLLVTPDDPDAFIAALR